ncbi:hypothetical protein [Streptomyces sp. NPDC018000]|uniref:hypothetical protein n=1 Tax=Streptomyces sp. NPDC018000 TaxID=3365028 RepID=UPI0037BA2F2D
MPGGPVSHALGHEELRLEALAALGDVTGFEQQIHAWADGYRARGWPGGTPDYLLYEVAGVKGLYSHVPLTMEQEIADSLRTRWPCFVAGEGESTGKRHLPLLSQSI